MPGHRRGKSLSDAITLERSEDGSRLISSNGQRLENGDEVSGGLDDKVPVLTRSNLSKSLDNLDQCASPKTMLKDSYSKLYNAKIKRFMKEDLRGADESRENGKLTVGGSSKIGLKHDTDLPRLGVDFGLMKPKRRQTSESEDDADSESDDTTLTYGSNLNLPPLGLGSSGAARSGTQEPRWNLNTDRPSVDLSLPDIERPQVGLEGKGTFEAPEAGAFGVRAPEMGMNLNRGNITGPSLNASFPKVGFEEADNEFKMPKFNLPDLGLSGPSLSGTDYKLETPDINIPDVPPRKINVKHSKKLKKPNLNVDDFSGYVESPKFSLSGRSPDFDQLDLNGQDIDMNSHEFKTSLKKPKIDLKSPGLDLDAPAGKLTTPKFGFSGKGEARMPDLKTPQIRGEIHAPDVNPPRADLTAQAGQYKAPRFEMPKFDLPEVPDLNENFEGPDLHLSAPNLRAGKLDPNLNFPSADISGHSGKIKMPGFGLSTPKSKGGIDLPRIDLKKPKLDLNSPDMDINMPSGNLDLDADVPSGKIKLPKFKLFGTLPKSKDVDVNAGMKTPELNLKSPKLKGIDAPDVSLPNVDLNAPDVNIGSPKWKFSKPGFDIDAPSLDMKGPRSKLEMPNADIGGFSGKMKMPDFGSSGPKMKGFGGEVNTPDFDLSAPKLQVGSSDLDLPEMHFNKPKLDLSGPDVDLDLPSGKFQGPEIKKPNFGLNAPDAPKGKFQMPKFNLSNTLPKGPNLDINADLKSPDLNLKAPKIKGGIETPDWDLPNMDVKAPKLDVKSPDVNIGSPKSKFKLPKFKMPKFSVPSLKGPDISGNLDGPDMDINAPKLNLKAPKGGLDLPDFDISGPSGKFKKPNFGLSGPKLEGPNLDFRSPDLDLSGPNLSGGINAPDINMPKVDLKSPKLDLNAPKLNLDMPSGKMKMPELHAPDWDVKAPSGKLKMPKFSLPSLKGPEIDGNFDGPDMDINAPKLNLKGPKGGLDLPDLDISGPSGKLKKPNFNLKSPNLDLSGPEFSGGINAPDINMPKVDLKGPKLDLNAPKLNLDMPSGKMKMPELHAPDWDVKAPSGKLKMPKLNLSGTLPKGPNINTDLNLKAPKIKGGLSAPDWDLPNMDLKAPKLDVNTPDIKLGSPKTKFKLPKMKMPKVSLPSLKGPEIDGGLDVPDFDVNAPDVNLRRSKPGFEMPDVDFGGRIKKPHLKMPDVGFSGPSLDGPNFDVKTPGFNANLPRGPNLESPDFNLKAPKVKGGLDAPKLDFPGIDLKAPKFDMNTPDVNMDLTYAKVKKPKIKTPIMPNVDLNVPDTNLSSPQLRGPGLSAPDINLPNSNFKSPKFNLNAKRPDLGIDGNLGRPDMNLNAPQVKGGIRGPDFDMNVPSGNFQRPQADLDSFNRPQFGSPDLNQGFSSPNAKLNVKPVEFKGNISGPRVNAPNIDPRFPTAAPRSPALHYRYPDLNVDDPSLKFRGPSYQNRRSDMRIPDLDVDGGVRLHHSDRKSHRNPPHSFPVADAGFRHRSDLNIDDFTGKDHVLRARGAKLDVQASRDYRPEFPPSGLDIDVMDAVHTRRIPAGDIYAKHQRTVRPDVSARDPRIRVPNSSDGYYVTSFPAHTQNQRTPNRKYNTLGGLDFHSGNVELEVPNQNEPRGSNFVFADLV